jgi:hypothetical protein
MHAVESAASKLPGWAMDAMIIFPAGQPLTAASSGKLPAGPQPADGYLVAALLACGGGR